MISAKLQNLLNGDPAGPDSGLFGVDLTDEESRLVLLPVPWDATASYGKGAAAAPKAIVKASHQLDLADPDFGTSFLAGIKMAERLSPFPYVDSSDLGVINRASQEINLAVYEQSKMHLKAGRFVGVVGGDHSSPFGLVKALGEKHKKFGILHVDAHHDLRIAYEGYEHSHASIMYNLLEKLDCIEKLVTVGIRDYSLQERDYAKKNIKRVLTYYDRDLANRQMEGVAFTQIAKEIIEQLPKLVYVSFDIDGLEPWLCPGTGTPVPGGLTFNQTALLLATLVKSGRKVVGFDLCEVAPQNGDREWNANVGARVLYKLCGSLVRSNKLVDD